MKSYKVLLQDELVQIGYDILSTVKISEVTSMYLSIEHRLKITSTKMCFNNTVTGNEFSFLSTLPL